MEEVAHDPVPRRPAVALTGAVVDAEVSGVGRGLTALGAETHDRNPRRPTDLSIAALLGSGLDLSFGEEPKGQSCSSPNTRGSPWTFGGYRPCEGKRECLRETPTFVPSETESRGAEGGCRFLRAGVGWPTRRSRCPCRAREERVARSAPPSRAR